MICHSILVPVIRTVRFLVQVVREVVRTVCELVTTTLTVAREVCEEVCGWLGPFSFLCDWVCKVVEVVECENALSYGIDSSRFAFMGNSSGGWATAFAATTSDILELDGETGVDGTSSAVQVAVPFFPPTDFLSMDTFAAANNLPMGFAYPHDSPTSPEGFLVHCPGEGPSVGPPDFGALVSIQACPNETEEVDPTSYIDGTEIPMWLFHGLADPLLPYNQSQLVYEATTAEGNEARFTLVPSAGHSVDEIIDAAEATTWTTNRGENETVTEGSGPSWDEIEHFINVNLSRARGGPNR